MNEIEPLQLAVTALVTAIGAWFYARKQAEQRLPNKIRRLESEEQDMREWGLKFERLEERTSQLREEFDEYKRQDRNRREELAFWQRACTDRLERIEEKL